MNNLNVFNHNGAEVADSREVAEMIGKSHGHLLRDIGGYIDIMKNLGQSNFGLSSDFFISSVYTNAQNREMPCYLINQEGLRHGSEQADQREGRTVHSGICDCV